jgi:dihydrofolate synthase/folylpolyglutamate synthase
MDAIAERAAEIGPTYFELTTALAWLHFVERAVDVAVLEVGMGGRLDSTNVCQPVVTVVTNISFDHTKQLGNTLALIAGEKAGILKPGVPAISGVLTDEPRQVIERVAREQGCRLVQLGRDFEYVYRAPLQVDRSALDDSTAMPRIDFNFRAEGQACQVEGLALGLLGQHQGANAALALAVWQELVRLGWRLPEEAVRRGLAEVRWPARIELVRRRPAIIVDSAHNVASITALLETLAESFAARRRVLIFATTRDKDLRGMLRLLLPAFETVVFTRYENNPRGVPPEELLALARELNIRESSLGTSPPEPIVAPTPAAAWAVVRDRLGPDDLLCITGSFFIAAELRTAVRG